MEPKVNRYKKSCEHCKQEFDAINPMAKWCPDCRYSYAVLNARRQRSNTSQSSSAFLRLFNRWIDKLSKQEKDYIVKQLSKDR